MKINKTNCANWIMFENCSIPYIECEQASICFHVMLYGCIVIDISIRLILANENEIFKIWHSTNYAQPILKWNTLKYFNAVNEWIFFVLVACLAFLVYSAYGAAEIACGTLVESFSVCCWCRNIWTGVGNVWKVKLIFFKFQQSKIEKS